MQLVVTEKPSVAQAISHVIGAKERKDGYMEGNGFLVSWCVGHLVELAQPEMYSEAWKKWSYESLPMIPEQWQHEVKKETATQYKILKNLMHDTRVESVVCATDAGREGELIFRLVYEQAGCRKPMKRLWISSMEESAIRDGFENLKPMQRLSSTVTVILPPPFRMNIITETFLFCNSFPPSKAADLLEDPTDFVTLFSFTSSCIYAMLWVLCRPPCPGFPGPVPIGGSHEAPHP